VLLTARLKNGILRRKVALMSVVNRPGNKLPSLATGFASDRVHRAGDEASDDG
jgi:hypothetical protein